MTHLRGTQDLLARLYTNPLLTIGGMAIVAQAGQTTAALAADHVIACIRTAAVLH